MTRNVPKWVPPGLAGAMVGALLVGGAWLWSEQSDADGLEPGELRILSGADDSTGKWRQTLLDMWNADHPRNPATIQELPEAADGQRSQMVAENPDIDVYNLDVTMMAEFAAPHGEDPFIRELDQSRLPPGFLDGFLAKPLESCRYKDPESLWALPLNTDAGLLFYRADLVSQPPAMWNDVTAVARQTAPHAYATQLGDYEGLTVNALEAIWAEGGEVVDDSGAVVATAETMRRGIRRLMGTPVDGGVMHPRAHELDETGSREVFASGEALFMRNWPVQYSRLLNDDVSTPKRVDFQVTTLPGSSARVPGPSVLGGQNLAIAANTPQPKAAQALIEFMTQESSQLLLARYGGFAPTRERPYQDRAIRERYPYLPALETAIEHAKLRPATPHYAHFSTVFRDVVTEAMANDGQPPADFAERLANAMRGR